MSNNAISYSHLRNIDPEAYEVARSLDEAAEGAAKLQGSGRKTPGIFTQEDLDQISSDAIVRLKRIVGNANARYKANALINAILLFESRPRYYNDGTTRTQPR